MKSFLNNWRQYTQKSELQLLIEGRVDDVKKKYPNLAKKIDSSTDPEKQPGLHVSYIDRMAELDPSGNQKYLMWAAKALNQQIEQNIKDGYEAHPWYAKDNQFSILQMTKNIMGKIKEYHEVLNFVRDEDKRFRDINNVRDWPQLNSVITGANNRKSAKAAKKAQKERESAQAKAESRIVLNNEDFLMLRPETSAASCFYGKGTQWCISATQSNNYFQDYTSEGKAFYFLFLANLKNSNKDKKLALVIDMNDGFEEVFDVEDDSGGQDSLEWAIIQNILNEKEDPDAWDYYLFIEQALPGAPPDEELEAEMEQAYINAVKKLAPRGIKYDPNRKWESNDALKELAQGIADNIIAEAEADTGENPPGPSEEEYDKTLEEYEFNTLYVDITFPSESGHSVPYWQARGSVDIADIMQTQLDRLRWKITTDQIEDMEDEFKDIVSDALNTSDIWPEYLEQEYKEPLKFYFDMEMGSGSVQDFGMWLSDVNWHDEKLSDPDDFAANVLKNLIDAGYIGRSEKEEEYWPDEQEIQKQQELPLQELKTLFAKYKKILK